MEIGKGRKEAMVERNHAVGDINKKRNKGKKE